MKIQCILHTLRVSLPNLPFACCGDRRPGGDIFSEVQSNAFRPQSMYIMWINVGIWHKL